MRKFSCKAILTFLFGALVLAAQAAPAPDGAALREKYDSLGDALKNNPFGRPLVIESAETSSTLKGDVYAVVEHAFPAVSAALTGAPRWCDIVILHLNTKQCRATGSGAATMLQVRIGTKNEESPQDANPVDFTYRVAATSPEYFSVRLSADTGPLSTRDYRILLEAIPLEGNRTFLHMTYSYGYGLPGRIAMQAYLSTAGASKVGFTRTGTDLIGGMRGAVERNAMRYYLAIGAYLAAPGPAQVEQRLQGWFTATEQYRRQLHEIERDAYLAMKRKEVQLQAMASR